MAVPTVTPLPTPPNRTSGAGEFTAKADVFYGAMPQFQTDMNTLAAYSGQQVALADTARIAAEQADSAVVTRANEVATNTNTVVTRANEVATNTLQVAANTQQVATNAQAVADALASVADGPVTSVNGMTGVVTGLLSEQGRQAVQSYTLASTATTETLDLAASQVFRVDASAPRTLVFANEPGADRAMTVVVHLAGSSGVVWPVSIAWDEGQAPTPEGFTRAVLFWDGVEWTGNARTRK